jgi:hypothetical protein
LIADKQQVLLDELLSMKDVTQEELVGILKDMGQTAEDDETLVRGSGPKRDDRRQGHVTDEDAVAVVCVYTRVWTERVNPWVV